jgi:hypothetical protein
MQQRRAKMLKQGLLALLIAMAAVANIAQAQPKKGPNGGMTVTSQGHPIEFVLKGQEIIFYVSDDDGSPLSTKDMRGRATVQDGGKTTTIPLEPVAPNMMIGKLQALLGSKARVVFSANLHGHSLVARYVTE